MPEPLDAYAQLQPLVQKDIRKIAQALIDASQTDSQFSVLPVPYHVHNGTDTPFISPLNFDTTINGGNGGGAGFTISGTITTTDNTLTTANLATIATGTAGLACSYVNAKDIADGYYANFMRTAGFKNASGSVVFFDEMQDNFTMRQQTAWDTDFDNSTNVLRIRVQGSNSQTIVWNYACFILPL